MSEGEHDESADLGGQQDTGDQTARGTAELIDVFGDGRGDPEYWPAVQRRGTER